MAAPLFPNGVNAQGAVKVIWVETLTTPTSPKLSEVSAGTSLDVSSMLYEGGWGAGVDANKVSARRRLSSTKVYEKFGTTTETLTDLQYLIDPQSASGSDGKKAYEALTEGSTGYFVERLGLDADSDLAVGQFVNVYPVVLGPQTITGDTSDEAAEFQVTQPVGITGQSQQNKALVA